MNLLELQQRANLIVDKVNQYEASLVGTEIDETDTLNQHIYADLYCLRPVMKMLFGSTIEERLNRTLDNDLALRVFASSAPSWNSSFNLLSYKPGNIIDSNITYKSIYSGYTIPNVFTKQEVENYKYNPDKNLRLISQGSYHETNLYYGVENLSFTTGEDVQTTGFIISQDVGIMLYQKQGRLEINKYGGTATVIVDDLKPNTTYYINLYLISKRVECSTDKINWITVNLNYYYTGSYTRDVFFGAEYSGINSFPGTINLSEITLLQYNDVPSKLYSISLSERFLGSLFGPVQIDDLFVNVQNYSNQIVVEAQLKPSRPLSTDNINAGPEYPGDSYIYKTRYTVIDYLNLNSQNDGCMLFKLRATNADYSQTNEIVEYTYKSSNNRFEFSGASAWIGMGLPRNLVTGDTLDVTLYLWIMYDTNNNRYCLRPYYELVLNKGKSDEWTGSSLAEGPYWTITDKLKPTTITFCSGGYNLVQDLRKTFVETYLGSFDVGYKSEQHEFVQNVDMMNTYNMLQLDAMQNTVTDRDTRIKQGINYSYSANIADALVTESQVANIFNWNTTNDTQVLNNTITNNRQVPGIVCYYLGNDFKPVYTATIPWSNIYLNEVNYSTPPYYGAFYRNDSVFWSQRPEYKDTTIVLPDGSNPYDYEFYDKAACKQFIPGMTYTRGKLISPQQIWQPDKIVGDANIGLGYNWQGGAIYHELVFKKKRDITTDFVPALDSVPDNDPQGLATRFALAQQRPYYNNRPWFNELNSLYGQNATKLAEYIINTSQVIPEQGAQKFDKTLFTLQGEVELSDAGILEPITASTGASIIYGNTAYYLNTDDSFEIYSPKIYTSSYYSSPYQIGTNTTNAYITATASFESNGVDVSVECRLLNYCFFNLGTLIEGSDINWVQFKYVNDRVNNVFEVYAKTDKSDWSLINEGSTAIDTTSTGYTLTRYEFGFIDSNTSVQKLDLSTVKLVKNGEVVFNPVTIEGEHAMNDTEFFETYRLDYDTFSKAVDLDT